MAINVRALAVVGLGFGDESKGSTVDFLTRLHAAKLVIRFNGGCQAAHNVVEPTLSALSAGSRHHTFAQFGSGTLAGAATYLAPGMLVEPFSLLREADVLESKGITSPLDNLSIDPECVITTPYHEIVNRAKENALGSSRHGSCGRGIGETRSDELDGIALRMKDLRSVSFSRSILREIKVSSRFKLRELDLPDDEINELGFDYLSNQYLDFRMGVTIRRFDEALNRYPSPVIIFEGAQGILLDELYGFAPYNTWTDCSFKNVEKLCSMGGYGLPVTKIGCLRAYSTRHGAGPFVAESEHINFPEPHNAHSSWQGCWRQGYFDAVMARYALDCVGGVDELAISHLDCFNDLGRPWACVDSYEGPIKTIPMGLSGLSLTRLLPGTQRWSKDPISAISSELGMPVKYASYGPTHLDKKVLD